MSVRFSRRFAKDYQRSPQKIKQKFNQRLTIFIDEPHAACLNNHSLTGQWRGYRSINVTGDWRAIFIETDAGLVIFAALGTHSQIYG